MKFEIRKPDIDHRTAIISMLHRLADFDIPPGRNPQEFSNHDAKLVSRYFEGNAPESEILIACDIKGLVIGVLVLSQNLDPLNNQVNTHIEVLVVARLYERKGIGSALLEKAEQLALAQGSLAVSLNVFRNNRKARRFYQLHNFDEELIRCIKRF